MRREKKLPDFADPAKSCPWHRSFLGTPAKERVHQLKNPVTTKWLALDFHDILEDTTLTFDDAHRGDVLVKTGDQDLANSQISDVDQGLAEDFRGISAPSVFRSDAISDVATIIT
jgi:hypothetical protein